METRTASDPRDEHALYIGLMSGTSLDGVDAALVAVADGASGGRLRILAHHQLPFSAETSRTLLALNRAGPDELHRAACAGNDIARGYAQAVQCLLDTAHIRAPQVRAIGAHGQTVRHQPRLADGVGYTLQIGNAALLAELTGIDVVADFRSRDVAAGGLGAPLAPAFHEAVFGRDDSSVAVLNVGGIANITALPRQGPTTGFDCGPGNLLMDGWCARWLGTRYDVDGAWAASGRCVPALLSALQREPFFALPPPKATGRDLFHAEWLDKAIAGCGASDLRKEDVQATLSELTAWAADAAIRSTVPMVDHVLVCGGGAYNRHSMQRLTDLVGRWSTATVTSSATAGIAPDQVEAAAFAWLASQFMRGSTGNLPAVTGANGPRLLGALYPA